MLDNRKIEFHPERLYGCGKVPNLEKEDEECSRK